RRELLGEVGLEQFRLPAVLLRVLLPDEGIRRGRVERDAVVLAERPQLEQRAFQNRLRVEAHAETSESRSPSRSAVTRSASVALAVWPETAETNQRRSSEYS